MVTLADILWGNSYRLGKIVVMCNPGLETRLGLPECQN